ncbi:hypothetical protein VQL36_13380 [Chengkuizengella sp. SCS-71B]|uniref:hypothetical protein n=1 Tax=Chengkuizengella sp. SCS-71B TaxID=3115290 RepID=UPI0032C2456E
MNTMKLKPNAIMFTHNDLDGIVCGILFQSVIGYGAEVNYCGYYNVDEKIIKVLDHIERRTNEHPQIIISDLGIKPETAECVDRYEGEKILLDHHKTNRWIQEKYDCAIIDEEASGTLLVFDYIEGIPDRFRDFAIRVDDYDRWVHAYPDSKRLKCLFYVLGIERFVDRCLNLTNPIIFTESDELLLELGEEAIERYIHILEKGIVIYELTGDKQLGVVFADRYQSEAGHELLNRLNLDAIIMIDANNRKISMRSKPHTWAKLQNVLVVGDIKTLQWLNLITKVLSYSDSIKTTKIQSSFCVIVDNQITLDRLHKRFVFRSNCKVRFSSRRGYRINSSNSRRIS